MLFYLIVLFLTVLFFKPHTTRNNYFSFWLLLFLAIIRANTVGLDTMNYLTLDSSIEHTESVKAYEYLFFVIARISRIIGGRFVIIVFAVCTFLSLRKTSNILGVPINWVMMFFLLMSFYNLSINISRQFTAVAIVSVAYAKMITIPKSNLKDILIIIGLIFIAAGFHISALIALIVIPWMICFDRLCEHHKNETIAYLFCTLLFILFCGFHYGMLSNDLLNLLLLTQDFGDALSNYATYYEQAELIGRGSFINELTIWAIFLCKLFTLYFILLLKEQRSNRIASVFVLSILISLMFAELYGNLNRIQYYFSISDVFVYSYAIKTMFSIDFASRFRQIRYLYIVILLLSYFISFYSVLKTGAFGTIPYNTILF